MAKKAAGDSAARLFRPDLLESRAVAIPADLAGEERARFVQRIAAGVRQQAGLAGKSDAVLRVEPDVHEQGDTLIFRHEPAACVDVAVLLQERPPLDLPTLWWISSSAIRALKAAAADGAIHGGIQPGTVYRDAAGRIKLGDFGIASAFETICGIEKRRQIHLASEPQKIAERLVSGVWSLLDESETRDQGWIAPFFGHELLEGRQRLNAKSDQFALGAVLYMLATGAHPYGADVADPGLNFYMFVEPAALADERKDWAGAFDRRDKGLAAPSDNPLFGWQTLIVKLLHSDPGERFANPAEAEKACVEFVDAAWTEAAGALQKADTALRDGNPEGFLDAAGKWRDDERLPQMWRSVLAAAIDRVNSEKERIVKARKLDQQLKEAETAIESGTLDKARTVAQGVIDSPLASETQREAGRELIRIIEEQRLILESGADELAREFLETAAAQFASGNSAEARQTLDAVLHDPATPSTRQTQAKELLAEIALAEQRREQQVAELSLAEEERKAGQYTAATQRLESLLATQGLDAALAERAKRLLGDVRAAEQKRREYAQALDDARTAWESADLQTLESRLAAIPAKFDDETIAEGRTDLAGRAAKLKTALAAQADAEKAISTGKDEPALAALDRALHEADLPQRLLDALRARRDECHKRVELARRELIERAVAALDQAQAAYAADDFTAARTTIEKAVLSEVALPAARRRDAETLLEACQHVDRVRELLEAARVHIADADVDSTERLLASVKLDGLPKSIVAEVDAARHDLAALRSRQAQAERTKLGKSLDEIELRIARGSFEDVEANLKRIGESTWLDDALKARVVALRRELDRLRPLIKSLVAAEKAIKESAVDLGPAQTALESLKADVPDWLAKRRDAVRAKIDRAVEDRRAEAIGRAGGLLDAAQAAVGEGDAAAARARLDEFRASGVKEPGLIQRSETVAAAAKLLESYQSKVEAVRAKLSADDPTGAIDAAAALAKDSKLPAVLAKALESIAADARKRIAARRGELDAELTALAGRISQKGKRDRGIPDAIAKLKADSLATDAHRKKADELSAQYAALPEPKSPLPMIAAIVAVLAVAGGAAYWFTRPKPPPTPAELIAAAQARLSGELQTQRQRAGGENRETPAWTIEFRPRDGFPTTAIAIFGGQSVPVGDASAGAALDAISLGARYDELFPRKPEPTVSQRIAGALNRLNGDLAKMKTAAGQQNRETHDWNLAADPSDKLPTKILATRSGAADIALGEAADAAALETLSIAGRIDALFPMKQPNVADVTAAGLARLNRELTDLASRAAAAPNRQKRSWALELNRAEPFPVTLSAKREGETLPLGTFADAAALDAFKLAARFDVLYPEMKPPTDSEVISAALDRVKAELASLATTAAAASDREKYSWTLAINPADKFPVKLTGTRTGAAPLELGTFANAAALDAFKLADKLDLLFPRMPMANEVIAQGLVGLTTKLGELRSKAAGEKRETPEWTIVAVTPDKLPTKLEARAAGRNPLPLGEAAKREDFAAIDLAGRYNDLFPIPTTVKAIKVDAAYDGRLRFTPAAENAVVTSAAGVTMSGTARLESDARDASFAFKGSLSDEVLTADAATKAAFATYLAALQVAQAGKLQLTGLAQDWKSRPAPNFKGGDRLAIEITDAAGAVLASAAATWSAETLEYTLEDAALKAARTTAIRAAAARPEAKKALLDAFAAQVPTLAPAPAAPGSTYFSTLKAIDWAGAAGGAADGESAPAIVTLAAAAGAHPEDRIDVDATIRLVDGRLGWQFDAAAAKGAVARRLAALSTDEGFQERRREETREQIAAAAGSARAELVKEGDDYVVRVADGAGAGDHKLTWNVATLAYDRQFTAKTATASPAELLAQRLAAAARAGTVDLNELDGVLSDVAAVKRADVFGGAADVRPIGGLGSGAGVAAATTALRRLMDDPAGADARVPNIFVEYIQTSAGIYGVSWQSDEAGRVKSSAVWLAVDAASLPQLATARAVRTYFADEANGERLLGAALGTQVAGAGGSLGLMVAPDGPLWYVRWEAVKFRQRPVAGVANLRARETPANCTSLRDLLDAQRLPEGGFAYRRVGIWPLPSLVCEWTSPSPRPTVRIGAESKALRFADALSDRSTNVARILDDDTTVRDTWTSDKNNLVRDNVGYRFWDAGYSGPEWTPQRTITFVVILRAQ
ncbi:MAG: hypothetical protein AMXMBFR47_17980 [Planctomycetota bacterium]